MVKKQNILFDIMQMFCSFKLHWEIILRISPLGAPELSPCREKLSGIIQSKVIKKDALGAMQLNGLTRHTALSPWQVKLGPFFYFCFWSYLKCLQCSWPCVITKSNHQWNISEMFNMTQSMKTHTWRYDTVTHQWLMHFQWRSNKLLNDIIWNDVMSSHDHTFWKRI